MGCGCCSAKKTHVQDENIKKQPLGKRARLIGVHDGRRTYSGPVRVMNETAEEVKLEFDESRVMGSQLGPLITLAPGEEHSFDLGEDLHFDYLLIVCFGKVRATVMRNGTYRLVVDADSSEMKLETVSLPERVKSSKLAALKDISFSFSASGWLVMYQLGCAECLQNHGINANPYVRASGASGGALTSVVLMYGADPKTFRASMIQSAKDVHKDTLNAVSLRKFVIDAIRPILKDGSFLHPAFQSERVEIAVSQTASKIPGFFTKMAVLGSEHRIKNFKDSCDIAIACLASSTCGLSGLPFAYTDQETGEKVTVADGAFKNFLPTIDNNSITVKPFCDGLDILSMTGKRADVGPTEYVPGAFGAFPPPTTMLEHLYELGYQDMETWLDNNLEARVEQLRADVRIHLPDLPPTEFVCDNDGELWYDEFLMKVPMSWKEMLKDSFYMRKEKDAEVIHESSLLLQKLTYLGIDKDGDSEAANVFNVGIPRWVTLTNIDMRWREESDGSDERPKSPAAAAPAPVVEEQMEQMLRGLRAAGGAPLGLSDEASLMKASLRGRVHLSWLNECSIDAKFEDCVHVSTATYSVMLKAASKADAKTWYDMIKQELGRLQSAVVDADEQTLKDAEAESPAVADSGAVVNADAQTLKDGQPLQPLQPSLNFAPSAGSRE